MDPVVPVTPIVPATPPMESVPHLPPPVKKTSAALVVGVVLLVLSLASVAAYFAFQYYQLKSQLPSVDLPVVVPTASTDPTENWKIYTNSQFGFSFKYPQSWIVDTASIGKDANTDVNTSSYIILHNPDAKDTGQKGYAEVIYITSAVSSLQLPMPTAQATEKIGSISFSKQSYPNGEEADQTPHVRYWSSNSKYTFFLDAVGQYPISVVQTQILSTFKFTEDTGSVSPSSTAKACTLEAKVCPDGSSVGRTGPNCEFAPCP